MSKRKRKELPEITGVEIVDVAAEGNSIARIDGMAPFIPFGAPGDIATIKLTRKKKNYAEGRITAIEKPSDLRQPARCEHFTICGGCRWQHLPYEFQLQCKQKQVSDALERIAKIELPQISDIFWERRG